MNDGNTSIVPRIHELDAHAEPSLAIGERSGETFIEPASPRMIRD